MLRTVCAALRTAVRIASATLVSLLPTTSVSRYTWSLTMPPPAGVEASTVAESRPERCCSLRRGADDPTPDVRTSRAPEYVVRRIPAPGRLRRLRRVPQRRRRSNPDVRHDPRPHAPHR